jgi:hypothetical protein
VGARRWHHRRVADPFGALRLYQFLSFETDQSAEARRRWSMAGWAANCRFFPRAAPRARRIEAVAAEPRYDVRARETRIRPGPTASPVSAPARAPAPRARYLMHDSAPRLRSCVAVVLAALPGARETGTPPAPPARAGTRAVRRRQRLSTTSATRESTSTATGVCRPDTVRGGSSGTRSASAVESVHRVTTLE